MISTSSSREVGTDETSREALPEKQMQRLKLSLQPLAENLFYFQCHYFHHDLLVSNKCVNYITY